MGKEKFSDDLYLTEAMGLRWRLEATPDHVEEASDFPWFSWVRGENGDSRSFKNTKIVPHEEQRALMLDLVRGLNKEIGHDGRWVTGWVHPILFPEDVGLFILSAVDIEREFRRGIMMWMDVDGDVQFTVEIDEPMREIRQIDVEHWIEQAEDGHILWRDMMGILGAGEGQRYKRAQGQAAPSTRQRNYEPLQINWDS